MKLYIVRHGQTEHNRLKLCHFDHADLNSSGILQSKKIAERLKNEKFDLIYCSPTKRAEKTLQYIKKHHKNIKINYSSLLKECNTGVFMGRPWQELIDARQNHHSGEFKFKPKGGESIEQVFLRIKKFYIQCLKKHEGQNILVVTHSWPILGLLCHLIGIDFKKSREKNMRIENCSLTLIQANSKKHDILLLGCTEHL